MSNFNCSIQDIIASQSKTRKASQFVEYSSKKQILQLDSLTEEHKKCIKELKGTFSFALHTSNKYLIVTLFNSKDKKYSHIIVDLETMNCAESDSIKNAKLEVMNLVNSEAETVKETVTETKEEPAKKTSRKKTNK